MNKAKEKSTSREVKSEASEITSVAAGYLEIIKSEVKDITGYIQAFESYINSTKTTKPTNDLRKHVAELIIYSNDERKNYENCLENNEGVDNHIWTHILAIAEYAGVTEKEAMDELNKV